MRPFILLALFPALLVAQSVAPPDPLDALVKNSPFLPASGASRAAAAGEGGPLEFRSVVFERGQFVFSIYDQASKQSKWIKLGPGETPFIARSYDREHDTLSLDYQGRSQVLKLQAGHIASQPPAGSAPAPAPLPSAQEAGRPNQTPNNPTAKPPANLAPAESQRLQTLADEMRRRRQTLPPPTIPQK